MTLPGKSMLKVLSPQQVRGLLDNKLSIVIGIPAVHGHTIERRTR